MGRIPPNQSRSRSTGEVKSTVERLSPTRVRINVEVPFDELKPDFDRAYKKIGAQVSVPGFRKGKVPARIIDARLGRGVVLEEVVNEAIPSKYSEAVTSAEDVSPLGQPGDRGHRDRRQRAAGVHRRGRRAAGDHAAGPVVARGAGRRRRGHRRRRRRAAGEPARPLRTLTGVERPAAKDDFVPDRPRGQRGRRGRRGGADHRLLVPGRPGRAHRRHRRGDHRPVRW